VQANIRESVRRLRRASELLARLEAEDDLLIVGAVYALETDLVSFLDI
jgi:carbonic anhydrase